MWLSLIKLLIARPSRERTETQERRSVVASAVNAENVIELAPTDARVMIAVSRASVRPLLSDPVSAEFSDCKIYSRGALGHAVCGVVDSQNAVGATVRNYFVTEILLTLEAGHSELFDKDPREQESPEPARTE
jgi:hypothetical protein